MSWKLYSQQGRYADAEILLKGTLTIYQKRLDSDHPELAQQLLFLAQLYNKQGLYAQAKLLFERALAIFEKSVGAEHPYVARTLFELGVLNVGQGHYNDAEPLLKRALAIYEKTVNPNHPLVLGVLNQLAVVYRIQNRYSEAIPLIRRTMAEQTTATWALLPILIGAQGAKLISPGEAFDDSLVVVQRAFHTAAGEALNALAVRFSAGSGRLAELVRKDQDLAFQARNLDNALIAAVSGEPSMRDAAAEQKIRFQIAATAKERSELDGIFTREFRDYSALSRPEPLKLKEIQALLADDEAVVIVDLGAKSYVWAITRASADLKELAVTADEMSKKISALRGLLDFDSLKPFDTQASFDLYQKILAPVEDELRAKRRLSFVLNGALTTLPLHLLVTHDPAGKALRDVDWLIRTYAVTVLPSVASLKVLRSMSAKADAVKPLIGFAPAFDRSPRQLQNSRVAAHVTASRGLRGAIADISEIKARLPPLPEAADELREAAVSVNAAEGGVILGSEATETRVKHEKLDQYRIVYFATHGLLAGEVADFVKLNAEPALVLSLPEKSTELDDGLLMASEVAQLKLNADWVVLSACNTAAGEKPGAEALSGLARAFFYAGARSLVVSNWEVKSKSTVALMLGTFAALAADPKLSHAQALQKSMLEMINDSKHPERADPRYWAPFMEVGEPSKSTN
jgi:CHAT domain-containing protein